MPVISSLLNLTEFPNLSIPMDLAIVESAAELKFLDLKPARSLSACSSFPRGLAWSPTSGIQWFKRQTGYHFVLICDEETQLPGAHHIEQVTIVTGQGGGPADETLLLWNPGDRRIPSPIPYPAQVAGAPAMLVRRYRLPNSREISRFISRKSGKEAT